jgi:2,3-bisphosphoglycerate-dependent phosphoglycerate mutase
MARPRIVAALVRHGEYHQPDRVPSARLLHPLTDAGVEQARSLAAQLQAEARALGLRLDPVLDCSTLLRARQTADLAAEALDQLAGAARHTVAEFSELQERSVGSAANLTLDAIAAALRLDPRVPELPPRWKGHPRFRLPVPGAESLLMAGARVAAHIEGRAHELRLRGGEDTLKLFIGHAGSLRHAAVCMGALDLLEVSKLTLDHCGYVLVEQVPDLDGGPGRWRTIAGGWAASNEARDRSGRPVAP